ncbi:MAG: hypothetical protein B6I24_03685 [Bacteroidetes bacterium 4572_128]|nr:MAG: hypothetical protein B6I24_03685 [Bacteroidetes bacterium 4572_128]
MKNFIITLFIITCFIISKSENVVIDSLKQQLKIVVVLEDKMKILYEIAKIYADSLPDESIKYAKSYMKIADEKSYKNEVPSIYNLMGEAYFYKKSYRKSIKYYKKDLEVLEETASLEEIMFANYNIASTYKKLGKLRKAIEFHLKSLKIAKELNLKDAIMNNCFILYKEYSEKKNFEEALIFYKNYIEIRNSNFNIKKYKEINILKKELKIKIENKKKVLKEKEKIIKKTKKELKETEIKKQEIEEKSKKIEREKQEIEEEKFNLKLDSLEKAIAIEELNKETKKQEIIIKDKDETVEGQKNIIYIFTLFSIIIIIFSILLFNVYKKKKEANKILSKQKKEIEEQSEELRTTNKQINKKNKQIIESITYARRIQNSILIPEIEIKKSLPNLFILYKPKDIVSGDFYWFSEIEDKIIIAAVDCTGHGVPGAFMSMIGDSLLYQIVNDKKIKNADKILSELHKGIRKSLNQEETKNQDGMDMALCVIDKKERKIEFSGAKNPLIYIHNDELVQIKGDKRSIGGRQKEKERIFKKHEMKLEKDTVLYVFSDGYQDQFGGKKNRKFMIKRLKELFLKIHKEEMKEQKKILNLTIERWMMDNKQLDDILIVGIKI